MFIMVTLEGGTDGMFHVDEISYMLDSYDSKGTFTHMTLTLRDGSVFTCKTRVAELKKYTMQQTL